MTADHSPAPEPEGEALVSGSLDRASFGYLVSLLARLMAQSLKARNGAAGILPGQYPIVVELMRRDGQTQRDLCRAVRIEQGTMANTLKRMDRDGLIERHPCLKDGRQATIHLTEKGRRLTALAIVNANAMNRAALSVLDDDTRGAVSRALKAVIDRLDADLAREGAGDGDGDDGPGGAPPQGLSAG